MGSGVLLAALVVLWFVVLVPMVVTRGDSDGRVQAADGGRTLQRRRSVDTVRHAATERVEIDREVLRTTGELKVDVHALRRRALGGLVLATLASLAGALLISPSAAATCRRRTVVRSLPTRVGRCSGGGRWTRCGMPRPSGCRSTARSSAPPVS